MARPESTRKRKLRHDIERLHGRGGEHVGTSREATSWRPPCNGRDLQIPPLRERFDVSTKLAVTVNRVEAGACIMAQVASADLTLLDDTLMAVERTLHAILVIVGLGWQQAKDLIIAAKRRWRPAVGRKAYGLSDGELVSFHALLSLGLNGPRPRPA